MRAAACNCQQIRYHGNCTQLIRFMLVFSLSLRNVSIYDRSGNRVCLLYTLNHRQIDYPLFPGATICRRSEFTVAPPIDYIFIFY